MRCCLRVNGTMVFEKTVISMLKTYLGPYVKNLDSQKLDISVWKGKVELEDLELNPDALHGLGLPIKIVAGSLKKLVLQVPWSSLSSKPVVAEVEEVFLVVGPDPDFKVPDAVFESRDAEAKAKWLENDGQQAAEAIDPTTAKDAAVQASFTKKILENIQLSVKRVHIRYEDSETAGGTPFAAGVTLGELSIKSCDKQGVVGFVYDSRQPVIRKVCGLIVLY